MSAPEGDASHEEPRVVIRDKRRIDPTSGAPPGPAEPPHEYGKPMTENQTTTAGAPAGGDDLARQFAERTEDLQRVTAEYANYRRRVDRDRTLVADQAVERFAGQLFPIVDDIERARDHGDLEGPFKVVADRVLALLDGLSVAAFGKNGDPFDPTLHEAVMHDTSPDVDYPMVTTVLRPGFRRGERVLRTAMVAVTDPEMMAAASVEDLPVTPESTPDSGPTDASSVQNETSD